MKAVKDMTAYALWEKGSRKDSDNDADPETCKVTFHAGKGTVKVKGAYHHQGRKPLPSHAGT